MNSLIPHPTWLLWWVCWKKLWSNYMLPDDEYGFAYVRGVGGKRRSAALGEVRCRCGRLFGSRQRGGTAINRTSHLAPIPTYSPLTKLKLCLVFIWRSQRAAEPLWWLHYSSPPHLRKIERLRSLGNGRRQQVVMNVDLLNLLPWGVLIFAMGSFSWCRGIEIECYRKTECAMPQDNNIKLSETEDFTAKNGEEFPISK